MLYTLCAKKRCGKDTAARFIQEHIEAESYALAHPIKLALQFGLTFNVYKEDGSKITFEDINGETKFDREQDLGVDDSVARIVIHSALDALSAEDVTFVKLDGKFRYRVAKFFIDECEPNQPWTIRRFMQVLGTDICVNVDSMVWMRFMMTKYLECIHLGKSLIVTDCRQSHEIDILRNLGSKVIHITRPCIETVATDEHITEKGLPVSEGDFIVCNDGSLDDFNRKIGEIVGEEL